MWLQRFTHYLLRHSWQTGLLVFLLNFLPIVGVVGIMVGILGILIAAFVTLCKSAVQGALLTLAATLPYLISFFISGDHQAPIPLVLWAAVGVTVFSNFLTWAFAVMLRNQASFSQILQLAALLGVLLISVIHLAYPGIADWWSVQLQTFYGPLPEMAAKALKKPVEALSEAQLDWINASKQYASGFMMVGVLFNALLQLVVARWWQAALFNPGSLRRELHGIRLSQLAGILFIVSLVLSYLGNSVVLDIMPVLYLLFGVAGLSLVHYFFGLMTSPTAWFWLAVIYITLIITLPVSIMVVAILALLDIWLDMRKRFKKV